MKKITDIYRDHKIMPNLQTHQLRVAMVAQIICENMDIPVDKQSVVSACLLHDMGNIIKFNLGYFPHFTELEGSKYWQKVQDEYIAKYGEDEHKATLMIIKELGLSEDISKLVDCIAFFTADENAKDTDFNKKICAYADMRVNPTGIVSLEERLGDLRNRYGKTENSSSIASRGGAYPVNPGVDEQFVFESSLREIEKQIFAHSKIKPEDINDESVSIKIEDLKEYSL